MQACHLVPIVEPEVCIDGDHSMERFAVVSEQVISRCVHHLRQRNVCLEACILKLQMIIPGAEYTGPKPTPQQIAQQTYDTMQRSASCGLIWNVHSIAADIWATCFHQLRALQCWMHS